MKKEKKYNVDINHYNVDFFEYYDTKSVFGEFINNGETYKITNKNTPRQWFSYLCNDKFGSLVTNTAMGPTVYGRFENYITKYYHPIDYLIRTVTHKREIYVEDLLNNKRFSLFDDCEDLICETNSGFVKFYGEVGNIIFNIEIFVPTDDTLECWKISLKSKYKDGEYKLSVAQTFQDGAIIPPVFDLKGDAIYAKKTYNNLYFKNLYLFFGLISSDNVFTQKNFENEREYIRCECEKHIILNTESSDFVVVAGASEIKEKSFEYISKYKDFKVVEDEFNKVVTKRRELINKNYCCLPDKNMQNFLNVWLKNQLYLTIRYDRGAYVGYRDVMQDSWGYLLVEPDKSKEKILEGISMMFKDGRCPRQYDKISPFIDYRDFADSPIWIIPAITDYIKLTGDYDILNEKLPFYDDTNKSTVENHIERSLSYLYHSRGENGLILMRAGDWLDSLSGMNKFGPATSVWMTIACFYVGNLMAELYEKINQNDKANILKKRSLEYKKIVNDVAWDGNWFVYAFTGNGEPVGSHKCNEGKIYLNTQTWAIFSGIVDDQTRIEKIVRSVDIYLTTPYGPQLLTPPYVNEGQQLGSISNLRPGTYGNGSIYLHAATFKVFSDLKRNDYDMAYDTFMRILPNHCDNPGSRRTSEPYTTGNVHLGAYHKNFGQNIFSWFTATPAWLINLGFREIIGVKPQYDGILIEPKVPTQWNDYEVRMKIRNANYNIKFIRSSEDAIKIDDVLLNSKILPFTEKQCCNVIVKYK